MLKHHSHKRLALSMSIALIVMLVSGCGALTRRSVNGIEVKNAECQDFLNWYGRVTSWQQPSPANASASDAVNSLATVQEQWAQELEAIESADSTFVNLKDQLVKQQRDFATLQRQQADALKANNTTEQARINSVMEASVATVNQSVGELLRYCNQ